MEVNMSTKKAKGKKIQKKKVEKKKVDGVPSIRKIAEYMIMKAYNFGTTLQAVKLLHPQSEFSKKCYYWYRSHLVTEGKVDKADLPKATKVEISKTELLAVAKALKK
jgi:hypothetical protein